METLELTLVKKVNYKLKPFGRFGISMSSSVATRNKLNRISFVELNFDSRKGMPYTGDDEILFTKFMKKYKTDILVDNYGTYYTRIGDNWVEVAHKRLDQYARFLRDNAAEDTEESWESYTR